VCPRWQCEPGAVDCPCPALRRTDWVGAACRGGVCRHVLLEHGGPGCLIQHPDLDPPTWVTFFPRPLRRRLTSPGTYLTGFEFDAPTIIPDQAEAAVGPMPPSTGSTSTPTQHRTTGSPIARWRPVMAIVLRGMAAGEIARWDGGDECLR